MENQSQQSGTMSPIWKLVAITMLVTTLGGFIWHFSEMRDIRYVNNKRNDAVREEVKLLTAYNDVLKAEGLEAANAYLQKIPNTYGF